MSQDGFKERRAFTRFPVSIQVTFPDPALPDEIVHVVTKDISTAGLGLLTDKKLLPGINVNICLRMSDNAEEINLKGKVVWTGITAMGKYRIGIKLEGTNLKPIPLVLRILKYHQI